MPINYLQKIQLGEFTETSYRISPSPGLESVIEGFYVFSRDQQDNRQLIFNDGFPVLVFLQNSQDAIEVTNGNDKLKIKAAWASAGSIKNVYIKYHHQTDQIFIVRFHPGAFYRLFGLDARYFRYNPLAPLEDVAGNNFSIDDFFGTNSIKEKVAFIEAYVQNAYTKVSSPEVLNKTLNYIHKAKGNSTVRCITTNAGVNYKWLERSFVKNIGLLPKEYIQLHRFMNAYLQLIKSRKVDLMRIATSNGYYDANHFLKDFKTYTGKTPLAYLKSQSRAGHHLAN